MEANNEAKKVKSLYLHRRKFPKEKDRRKGRKGIGINSQQGLGRKVDGREE